MISGFTVNALFVVTVTLIWFAAGYQALLFFMGYRCYLRTRRRPAEKHVPEQALPGVSVLVPCHNEAVVIAATIRAMLTLHYPADRLEILIIDDGSSDGTGEIARLLCSDARVRVVTVPEPVARQGKSGALNYGLSQARHALIAVYDADNTPEPGALRPLVEALEADPGLGAAVGMYRAVNRHRNWLTRFLNIEGIGYQWIVQAGRWSLLRFTALPGTNFVIRRSLLEALGGWDPGALSEDAELTLRVYEAGYAIRFVPASVSWEQEPETIGVWLRQRHRWVRGSNHVFKKHWRSLLAIRPRRIGLELFYSLSLFYIFFVAIVLSDILFVSSLAGLVRIDVAGPYEVIWVLAFLAFVLQLAVVLGYEKDDHSPVNLFLVVVMYFTYCQLWIPVVARAFVDDFVTNRPVRWAKTRRFAAQRPLDPKPPVPLAESANSPSTHSIRS